MKYSTKWCGNGKSKHRKNSECGPVSLLNVRSHRLSLIQDLNVQNCSQCLKYHKSLGCLCWCLCIGLWPKSSEMVKCTPNWQILVIWSKNVKIVKLSKCQKLWKTFKNYQHCQKLTKIVNNVNYCQNCHKLQKHILS